MINKSFWESKHKSNDNFYLTGSNLKNINSYHNIDLDRLKNKSFLEIGVGHGNLSYELVNIVDKLICCDISENALKKVSPKVKSTHLTTDLKKIEPVDFALCHLVLQHCDDNEVERIINDVNLTDDGVMSIQVAFSKDDTKLNVVDNNVHFFRNLDFFESLISKTNKKIISTSKPFGFEGIFDFIGWYVLKLSNK